MTLTHHTPLVYRFAVADGANNGFGVYTSLSLEYSLRFSACQSSWPHSSLLPNRLPLPRYAALVEVAYAPGPLRSAYIQPDEAAVIVRVLFVLPTDRLNDPPPTRPDARGDVVRQVSLSVSLPLTEVVETSVADPADCF